MKNIVFIGMPGSGKTSISKMLARHLNRKWIDCDDEIENEEKMSISEIFAEKGESYFRLKETEIISKASKLQDVIISTGGGAVLLEKNIDMLKSNGFIIYLHRSIENIVSVSNFNTRPLLAGDVNKIHEIYQKRHGLYERYCDEVIENNGSKEYTLSLILDIL